MVWFSGWYDGPTTGLAVHDSSEYWFVMVTIDGGEQWDFTPRVYILHQLTSEQLSEVWNTHRSFAAAGIPGCLHSPPCTADSATNGQKQAALYDQWPPDDEDAYTDAPAIGWFLGEGPGEA